MVATPLSAAPPPGPVTAPVPAAPAGPPPQGPGLFAEDGPSFWDLLDVINPLQHIPVVNTIYRQLTGDEIGAGARLAGGAVFGGPIGAAAAFVNLLVENATGRDLGDHVVALFQDDPPPAPAAVQVAEEPALSGDALFAAAQEQPPAAAESQPPPLLVFDRPPAELPAEAAPAMAAAVDGRFMPLPMRGGGTRFMAIPGRGPAGAAVPAAMPAPTAASTAAAQPDPPALHRAAAQLGIAGQDHPMLRPAAGLDAAAAADEGDAWFAAKFRDAMDKYQRGARLGAVEH